MIHFQAMNTEVTVIATRGDAAAIAADIQTTFDRAERTFSRFRDDSELARLNRARDPTVVSPALFDALARARAYVELTDGAFDPGVGGALAALGYDRSFAPGALDRDRVAPPPDPGRFLDVVLDPGTRVVIRPPHVSIDLGGMIKGATVDEAAAHLGGPGAIDAGGDAALRGRDPTGDAWLVDIEDPDDPARELATIAISDAAVATSAANRRTWRVGGEVAHHLIDPRTQKAAVTDLVQATVVAPCAELADVLAKTAFVLGSRAARRFLERQPRVGAILVPRDAPPLRIGALDLREVARG